MYNSCNILSKFWWFFAAHCLCCVLFVGNIGARLLRERMHCHIQLWPHLPSNPFPFSPPPDPPLPPSVIFPRNLNPTCLLSAHARERRMLRGAAHAAGCTRGAWARAGPGGGSSTIYYHISPRCDMLLARARWWKQHHILSYFSQV